MRPKAMQFDVETGEPLDPEVDLYQAGSTTFEIEMPDDVAPWESAMIWQGEREVFGVVQDLYPNAGKDGGE